jgi:ubiquinone/menaquinone biosynthesis C-methylase UbiE
VTLDYDQLAAEYAQHRQVHPEVLLSLCQAASRDSRVLEVGCGTGNYVIALQSQVGCACWGTDPSQEMLNRARERSAAVHFRPGSAEQIEERGPFDLVFTVDVIHHVRDRRRYYAQAYDVLASGGKVCTATDSEWIIRHRHPLSTYFPETVEPELARYPRIDALRGMMAEAGFGEIVTQTAACTYPLNDVQMYRDKAFSSLHLISEEAFRRGIERIERDLEKGPIICTPRYTLLWGRRP